MSLFQELSFVSVFFTGALIFWQLKHQRYVTMKPSFACLASLFAYLQLPSAFQAKWIESYLTSPWDYFLIAQLFIPLALILTSFCFNEEAEDVYLRIRNTRTLGVTIGSRRAVFILSGSIFAILVWYLSEVPLDKTGLYYILFDPAFSSMGRERSMKLLDNQALKYGFTFMTNSIGRVVTIMLGLRLIASVREGKYHYAIIGIGGILIVLLAVSLYGGRSPSAMVLLGLICALFMYFEIRIGPIKFATAVIALLAIPAILTLMREGRTFTIENILICFEYVVERSFGGPVAAVWHVDYVDRNALFGVGGLGNIAAFLGQEVVNVANVVGVSATRGAFPSISANTDFVNTLYASIGLPAFFIAFPLVVCLDWVLLLYRSISLSYLVLCVAAVQVTAVNLVAASYTAVLFSYGLIATPLLCIILSRFFPPTESQINQLSTSRSVAFQN